MEKKKVYYNGTRTHILLLRKHKPSIGPGPLESLCIDRSAYFSRFPNPTFTIESDLQAECIINTKWRVGFTHIVRKGVILRFNLVIFALKHCAIS